MLDTTVIQLEVIISTTTDYGSELTPKELLENILTYEETNPFRQLVIRAISASFVKE
jgi:hypothetical protein